MSRSGALFMDVQEKIIQSYIDREISEDQMRAELEGMGLERSWVIDLIDEVNSDPSLDFPRKCRQCSQMVEGEVDGCRDPCCPMAK